MTVSTTVLRADANGNGVTTAFTANFKILDQTHIRVLRTQISTGVVTELALTTNYTVSGVGANSFTVTCLVAPTADQRISILRNIPLTQATDYVEGDAFPAASHENALDKLTMIVQQQQEAIDRSLTLAENSVGISLELPGAEANALIGWNTAATALENYAGAASSVVSTAMAPVVAAATIPAALSLLGTVQSATNLAAGSAGTIPYQSAAGTTAMLAAGTAGYALIAAGAAAPVWTDKTASTTVAGFAEFTTTAEVQTGTDTTRATTTDAIRNGFYVASGSTNTTSGTSVDITGIPSWANEIKLNFNGVSTNGTSAIMVRLGTGGSPASTGYNAFGFGFTGGSVLGVTYTAGFGIQNSAAANDGHYGTLIFTKVGSNVWTLVGNGSCGTTATGFMCGGMKSVGGTLDIIRITTAGGTDAFDAGSVNIVYS